MPRIAASVGALVLIVFSIGFNISRYPKVWEMVGATSHLPQSAETSQALAVIEPAADSVPEVALKATPVEGSGAELGDAWVADAESLPETSPTGASQAQPPATLTPSTALPAETIGVDTPTGQLVPLERLARQPDTDSDTEVRRLPPVHDDTATVADRSPGDPIPFYPSTATPGNDGLAAPKETSWHGSPVGAARTNSDETQARAP